MSYSISITKRTNGGYTVVADEVTSYPSQITYHGTEDGVIIQSPCLHLIRFYRPDEWTIQSATGYTTVTEVADALDALGVLPEDTLEDIEALLTTIDTDTGAMATSLAVLDDWDESDRAKVNPIVGQAGIAAGAGAVGNTVPRVTLASDDPAVTALQIMDDWDESDRAKVNIIAGQVGVDGNSGNLSNRTVRVAVATDDVNAVKIVNATEIMDDWDESDRAKVNLIAGQAGVDGNSGNKSDKTVRVVLATDQPQLTNSLKTVDDNSSSIKTAVELLDDTVKVLGTDTYTEASTKGLVVGAFRRDAETTMVDTTNEVAPLQVDATGRLKVTSQGRNSSPVELVAAGSAQNVTTGWVDFGSEITTGGADLLALWLVVTHTNSVNDRVRILAKHTGTSGAEFSVPIKTVSATDVKVQRHYYELDTDATQNIVLDWDVSAVPVVQVQIQCETVGAVADTISGDYTLKY